MDPVSGYNMSRQLVDIGLQGNDGTGDSIRESFRKVNENFIELYAVFNLGDRINFQDLGNVIKDLDGNLGSNRVITTDTNENIVARNLVAGNGILIDAATNLNEIKITSTGGSVASDISPTFGGPVNADGFFIAKLREPSPGAVIDFDTIYNIDENNPITTTEDEMAIPKGYADRRYTLKAGDVMTGPVEVPAGASGNQVPRASEVILRSGSTMIGTLTLADHPGALAGNGTPNGLDDLQAATKYYVDNSSFASNVDLYVSTTGDDLQLNTPSGKDGRAWAYAYRTVSKACEQAEFLITNSQYESGPYTQTITYTLDDEIYQAVVTGTGVGDKNTLRLRFTNKNGQPVDQGFTNDITSGKLIRGKISGAYGFIYQYVTTVVENTDYVDLQNVTGTFLEGEGLEFDNPVKILNITIYIESGIYEEDFPIKIPPNTSIVGDEFRRTIIRPKDRVSQSPWIDTWFFRNGLFDGLALITTGTDEALEYEGWYGYHYLENPSRLPNLGMNYENDGGFNVVASTIRAAKLTIANAVVTHVNVLSQEEITKIKLDVSYIVEAIALDLQTGGQNEILKLQNKFSQVTLPIGQRVILPNYYKQGLAYISSYINTSVIPNESATLKAIVTNMITKLMFAFDLNYNSPKNNKNIDVFLCNDSTIVRQITCQGHGGFMMVLDPNGQILTKSPYCQQSASFSGSLNRQAFRGGQYIDGFAGNILFSVSDKINNTTLQISGSTKEIQTPTSFFIQGKRYKVNSWAPIDSGDFDTGRPNASKLIKLNKDFLQAQTLSRIKIVYPTLKYSLGTMVRAIDSILNGLILDLITSTNIRIIQATRRLFNLSSNTLRFNSNEKLVLISAIDYMLTTSQIIIAKNDVLLNQTEYSQTKLNISIESNTDDFIYNRLNNVITTVRNGLSNINLIDYPSYLITLDKETPLLLDPTEITLITAGNISMLSNDYTQVNDLGYGIIATNNGLAEAVSLFTYYCWASYYSNNGGQIRSLNGSSAHGEYGLVSAGSDPLETPDPVNLADDMIQVAKVYKMGDYAESNLKGLTAVYINSFQFIPYNRSILEINFGSSVVEGGIIRYEIATVEAVNDPVNPTILKLNLNTSGNNDTSTSGLKNDLVHGQKIILRSSQNFRFNQVEKTNPTRPSTSITFLGDAYDDFNAPIYRVIEYSSINTINVDLPANEAILTFDSPYRFIQIIVNESKTGLPDLLNTGKTLGRTIGDLRIAIRTIIDTELDRVKTGQMIFAWDGKIHRITNYTSIEDYGIITISDYYSNGTTRLPDINTSPRFGLNTSVSSATNASLQNNTEAILRAGLVKNEPASILVKISTTRANGHDFLDIGSGGYNQTNYPDRIYGDPRTPNQANEVQERASGRVFYASTDQDGIYRVGRFFKVDQGTGTVTFSASIALSNLDGIGFKRGVAISEFSADDRFLNPSNDVVSTQKATVSYINKRLGIDEQGNIISNVLQRIGPGFLSLNGITKPTATMDWNNNRLTNLGTPENDQDATTKIYVDNEVANINSLGKLKNVLLTAPAKTDILTFIGGIDGSVNAEVTGDLSATMTSSVTSTLTRAITSLVNPSSIFVASVAGFVAKGLTRGYVLIGNEVFQYDGLTTTGDIALNGVLRLSTSTGLNDKFKAGVAANHAVGASVISLNDAQVNFQINNNSIVNADINSEAGIVQSKLSLQLAESKTAAPTGTATVKQAASGLSSFDTLYFQVTDGWATAKTEEILKNATWTLFKESLVNEPHAYTFTPKSTQGLSEFTVTRISSSVVNDAIVQRTNNGSIKINNINTNDNVTIISASGSADNATPVTYKGQWAPGSNASLIASKSTNLIGGNDTALLGAIPYQSNIDTTSFLSPNTTTSKRFLVMTGTGSNGAPPVWSAALKGDVGLGSVENTALSTWAGTANITTVGALTGGSAPKSFVGLGNVDNTSDANKNVLYATTAGAITSQTNSATIEATSANVINRIVLRDNTGSFGAGVVTASTITTTNLTTGDADTEGTITGTWSLSSDSKLQATYADLAEYYSSDKIYEPGTVLIFGGSAETTTTNIFGDTRLAGVVSEKPAYVMNNELSGTRACIALQGRVFCKVVGRVKKGDLLTTAGVVGHAAKAIDPKVGTIIGKALMDKDSIEAGLIEISVGRT